MIAGQRSRPTNDDIQMRGFGTRQFTTAGWSFHPELGGHWGFHFVDYSIILLEQIESIEIPLGPNSALYEGSSIGGVLNIKTKAPVKRETPAVKFNTTTSYGSLNTYDTSVTMSGGGGNMDYVLGERVPYRRIPLKTTITICPRCPPAWRGSCPMTGI
ncbi:MAG: TonB-dependent receptor plug domain-containing protein [Desulfobacterales bacterium]